MFYNFENLKEENFHLTTSSHEISQLGVEFFRVELMNVLTFSSEQYNLDFNTNIFWIFVAVVFFGILNLGFILLLLGSLTRQHPFSFPLRFGTRSLAERHEDQLARLTNRRLPRSQATQLPRNAEALQGAQEVQMVEGVLEPLHTRRNFL